MRVFKDRILSDSQLRRLGEHQYSCQSVSICDKMLQPYWNWLVQKVPVWFAPNLLTIMGLVVNIFTALVLVGFSPDAKQEPPRWSCALCAIGLFVYQSLDAIDGKQARRTGSANPLGELFDHGCDSLSTVFVAVSACTAVQLGNYPAWMFFQCFCAMSLFYCAHWQTYVSGTLRFGKVDVTEAQITIMSILLISAIFGPSIWSIKFFRDSISLWFSIALSTLVCGLWSFYRCFDVIFTGGVGKNGSTVAGTSVLSPVIPILLVVLPAFIIYQKSEQALYQTHPVLYIFTFGLVAAKVTNRLVVAHMTKSDMQMWDYSIVGPAMLFFNQYFNTFINEYIVLWMALIWVTMDLLIYCYRVCHEICAFLRVELFRIPYPGGPVGPYDAASEKNGTKSHNKTKPRSSAKALRPQ
ncbi:cholinephosphotransferase 1 isoform X2 [Dendroctonus ponderosae]|uniref:cholinephosphotransferase 1 isoform X2 n=1 Tax=Dendroctonus ponderosae TaxID=77166 RepID=UPI00203543B5|nr:cholinephosphotransferase 1 isoform X2 [Dendroctonus ponderosae]